MKNWENPFGEVDEVTLGGVVATFCSTIFHLKFVTNVWAYHFCRGKDPETHGDIFLDIATKVFHHGSKKSTV